MPAWTGPREGGDGGRMKPRSLALALTLVAAGCLSFVAGCFDAEPGKARHLPAMALGERQAVAWELAPDLFGPNHVPAILTLTTQGTRARLTYEHPSRPELDSHLQADVAAAGHWATVTFDCEPALPEARNTRCDPVRGGSGQDTALDGPGFGFAMLAGLPVGPDGSVQRPFIIGTQSVVVRFQVQAGDGDVSVYPVDPNVRSMVLGFGHANALDPLHCSVFTGVVTIDVASGLPVRCSLVEEDGDLLPVWLLRSDLPEGPGSFRAQVPTELPSSDRPAMPDGATGAMPFGLDEALQAARADPAVDAFMLRQPWLGTSALTLASSVTVGACPACTVTTTWAWDLRLHGGDETLEAQVTKTDDGLQPPAYAVVVVGREPMSFHPLRFPVHVAGLDAAWRAGAEVAGVAPVGIVYQLAYGDGAAFTQATGASEPYFGVLFERSDPDGLPPIVWLRADGRAELDQANGARAPTSIPEDCLAGCDF